MRLNITFALCVLGGAMFAIPNLTRRGVLFGFAVPPGFRASENGRKRIAEFRAAITIAFLAALAMVVFVPLDLLGPAAVGGPVLLFITGAVAFLWERRKVMPFATEPVTEREVEISSLPEKLPWSFWLTPGQFVVLGAAALFLYENWTRIPEEFPVHWGLDGRPDRWSHRTPQGAYGALLFGAEICAWMAIMAIATWFGARRSSVRTIMVRGLIAVEYLLAVLFAAISAGSLVHIPFWAVVLAPVALVVVLIVTTSRALSEPSDSLEPTPNDCWKAGVIYYNPSDPALFVEKRAGLGYTFNFGNRWSWLLAAGLLGLIATGPLLL